jgi:hypothetical protein
MMAAHEIASMHTRFVLGELEDAQAALLNACDYMGREFEDDDEQNAGICCSIVKALAVLQSARRNAQMVREALDGTAHETAKVAS